MELKFIVLGLKIEFLILIRIKNSRFLLFISIKQDVQFSVHFSSVAQSCPTLCDPMDCSTPGLPVHHWLPELTQTHVHRVGDAIQPSHPLLSPSLPAFNLMYNSRILAKQQLRISIYAIIFHQTTFPNIVYLLLWWW